MKKISNREEANFYYTKINDIVKRYTSSKSRPSEVRKFIENNLDKILNREGLRDVFGIDRVVDDVLDHHHSMEIDGVLTFEKFTFLGEGNNIFNHEKFLGDLFDCDLDSIELVDPNINFFSVSSFGETFEVFVFTKEEFSFIRENLIDKLVLKFGSKTIPVTEVENVEIHPSIGIKISDFWEESVVRASIEKEFSESRFKDFLPFMISSHLENTDSNISFLCGPPDYGLYVYSDSTVDLTFKMRNKFM